jgi:hypothetical protein
MGNVYSRIWSASGMKGFRSGWRIRRNAGHAPTVDRLGPGITELALDVGTLWQIFKRIYRDLRNSKETLHGK